MTIYIEQGLLKNKPMQTQDQPLLQFIAEYHAPQIDLNGKSDSERKELKRHNAEYLLSGEMTTPDRKNENVISKDAILIDYDFDNKDTDSFKITQTQLFEAIQDKLAPFNYAVYPSFSASKERVRYHLVIPLNRQLNEKEYQVTFGAIVEAIGVPTDKAMLTWSQAIGLPVVTSDNKDLPSLLQNDKKIYQTRDKASLENAYDKGLIDRFIKSPLILGETITSKEKTNTVAVSTDHIPDDTAIAMFKDYISKDRESLYDYTNSLTVINVLAKAVQDGTINEDVAYHCSDLLALGDVDWEKENRKKLAREIRTTKRTTYSFLEKFVLTVGNKSKYDQFFENDIAKETDYVVSRIDFDNDTVGMYSKDVLTRLTQEQLKQLYSNTSPKTQARRLRDKITNSTATKVIPTGFKELDKALDGGLYAGLYFIGAISSLGKTTFLLQLADQVAETGQPVMIFSLEMSRDEIMAKTLSRLTHIIAKSEGKEKYHITDGRGYDVYNGRTTRQITDTRRYNGYTDAYGVKHKPYTDYQKDLIDRAFDRYEQNFSSLYIHENDKKRISTEDIEETVKQFIELTGEKPLVIVDYLQIINPDDSHADVRFNVDDAVTRLKVLSAQNDIPVIAISSFNRENYSAGVSMLSFKESGGIEYSSDVLIGLQFARQRHVDEMNANKKRGEAVSILDHNAEKSKEPREIELKILKNRNGAMPKSDLHLDFNFDPRFNYYEEKQGGFKYGITIANNSAKSSF